MVLNSGWTISMIWSFVKNFLAKETVEKYVILSKDIDATFDKYIDRECLVSGFGKGTANYTYDVQQLIKEETEEEEELRKSEQ